MYKAASKTTFLFGPVNSGRNSAKFSVQPTGPEKTISERMTVCDAAYVSTLPKKASQIALTSVIVMLYAATAFVLNNSISELISAGTV